VTHAIATMMDVLRSNPGKFGLLNANGWFITKHSMGIYSTTPVEGEWRREAPADYQQAILDEAHPPLTESPSGSATIETYTVLHGREGAERALVIGLLDDGTRFIAETPNDEQTLRQMMDREMLGAPGTATAGEDKNLFVPDIIS
jgi:acetyl-CoA C-acetyltransferase